MTITLTLLAITTLIHGYILYRNHKRLVTLEKTADLMFRGATLPADINPFKLQTVPTSNVYFEEILKHFASMGPGETTVFSTGSDAQDAEAAAMGAKDGDK